MKNFDKILKLLICIVPVMLWSCNTNQSKKHTSEQEITPAIELKYIDSTVSPGDDFYRFANGGWLDANPVPNDQTVWTEFDVLTEQNNNRIKNIIEELSKNNNLKAGSDEIKIRDYYATGMDTAKINQLGVSPLQPLFDKIANIKTTEDFVNTMTYLQTMYINPLFYIYGDADKKNSSIVIANIGQSGLGLPNKEYYLSDKKHFNKIRSQYMKYISNMFKLIGDDNKTAEENAKTIMQIEKSLAEISFSMLELRDTKRNYNKLTVDELAKASPNIDWKKYFQNIGYPEIDSLNVAQLPFIKNLSNIIVETQIEDWKIFLKWELLNSLASYLSSDFENESFDFYNRTLSGQKQMETRWKRVLSKTNRSLGEAIGKIYVEKYFTAEAKEKMIALVKNLRAALAIRIDNLAWMSEKTKKAAKEKLNAFTVKVGYPDEWKDYSELKVGTNSYVENAINARKFAFKFNMDKIGKPINKKEWGMSPQTVNAYYSPATNEIVFPAAILQPPFFNLHADDAVNYGGIGVVIGHEMSHGFDDQGSQYDKDGNLKNWWEDEDAKKYKEQTQKLVEHFNGFVAIDSFHVNGELTLGENIGDFGGLTIALEALKIAKKGDLSKKIDNLTLMQRFFLSYAVIWRSNIKDEALKRQVKEDVHSPAKFRVNGGLFNVPEFYDAFNIKEDAKLYRSPEQRPIIW